MSSRSVNPMMSYGNGSKMAFVTSIMDIRTWSYLALKHPSRGQLAPSSTVYVYPPLLAGWWFGRRPAYGVNGGIDSLNNVGKTMS